jgi:hypothetical protein
MTLGTARQPGLLNQPIFLIGAARSGTTFVGRLLRLHPHVAYWIEPKYVWRYGNASAASDVRTAEEATPEVTRYIRGKFAGFARKAGKPRFAEKTPSNCLRVPFIHAVFPDGRFLHLTRDGRDAALSARNKWLSRRHREHFGRRLRSVLFQIPLREAPCYARDFL